MDCGGTPAQCVIKYEEEGDADAMLMSSEPVDADAPIPDQAWEDGGKLFVKDGTLCGAADFGCCIKWTPTTYELSTVSCTTCSGTNCDWCKVFTRDEGGTLDVASTYTLRPMVGSDCADYMAKCGTQCKAIAANAEAKTIRAWQNINVQGVNEDAPDNWATGGHVDWDGRVRVAGDD